ncbi:hybrid sensor histidine kinase/response regulator [Marinobacter salsuginis]|uniref:histidine kinase n=1 Tax=Marinobacter salsuginis TaxID=418719 RepID=A0A5M3PV30_9GAMM|nr:7TM diverse intracellular signaling domain-containing protein [Marinobacter salsuginis]GBO86783.1 hybrid sensor histidine kinase/response regulator [Marinobacter salsuginis]
MYRIGRDSWKARIITLFFCLFASSILLADGIQGGFLDLEPRIEVFQGEWDRATRPDSSEKGWTPLSETSFRADDKREFIWLRAEISKTELTTKPWLLLHPYIQKVTAFVDGEATTAEPVNFWSNPDDRPLPHHFIAIPLSTVDLNPSAQSHTIHLRVEPLFHINTFFYLLNDRELVKELTFHTALAFAFLAMIAIMAIYNLLLYFSVRDTVYLFYVAASVATLLYSALLMNVQAYVLDAASYHPKYGFVFGLISFILHVPLFQRLLDTRKRFPRTHRVANVIAVCGVFLLILSPLLTYDLLVAGWIFLAYPMYVGALVLAFRLAKRAYRPAIYFVVGWIPFLLAVTMTSLEYASFISPTNGVSYFIPAALSWEMALFSLALASRIKILRDERDTLQAQQIKVSEKARKTLERSNRIKDDFLNAVSHELRTPLHTIQGQLDLLREAPLNREQNDAFRLIEYANLRMTRQVGGILDFVDAQEENLLSSPQVFEPQSLFDLLEYEFREATRAKPVSLAFGMDDSVPGKIFMDGLMLEKVLYQLIDNAVKFTPAGGEVLVRASRLERDSVLRILVSDTGPGIPDSQREKVFQAFKQGEAGLTRRYDGVGLGLPLASSLVTALGGQMGVLETSEHGTTLEVTAPYGDVHQAERHDPELSENGSVTQVPRILVVEDDAGNRMILRKQLEKIGVITEGVQNGLDAVQAAINEPWDMIIMDCQMPVMDGIEATREIRSKAPANLDTPIIAVTANASESFRIQCLEAGMDDYCTKPLRMEKLKRLITNYAESRVITRTREQRGLKDTFTDN